MPDAEGHSQPYGRVHASVVVVPPHPTAAAKDGDKGHSIILFGGESTRLYMYHAGVWRARCAQRGVLVYSKRRKHLTAMQAFFLSKIIFL